MSFEAVHSMKFRKLRIAWSVGWGLAALLLCVLWVRSYWQVEQVLLPVTRSATVVIGSMPNVFVFGATDKSPTGTFTIISFPTKDWLAAVAEGPNRPWNGLMMFSVSTDGVMLPHWFWVLMSVAFATAPWLPLRFSLRTLLIAVTLAASVLGAMVWAVRS